MERNGTFDSCSFLLLTALSLCCSSCKIAWGLVHEKMEKREWNISGGFLPLSLSLSEPQECFLLLVPDSEVSLGPHSACTTALTSTFQTGLSSGQDMCCAVFSPSLEDKMENLKTHCWLGDTSNSLFFSELTYITEFSKNYAVYFVQVLEFA